MSWNFAFITEKGWDVDKDEKSTISHSNESKNRHLSQIKRLQTDIANTINRFHRFWIQFDFVNYYIIHTSFDSFNTPAVSFAYEIKHYTYVHTYESANTRRSFWGEIVCRPQPQIIKFRMRVLKQKCRELQPGENSRANSLKTHNFIKAPLGTQTHSPDLSQFRTSYLNDMYIRMYYTHPDEHRPEIASNKFWILSQYIHIWMRSSGTLYIHKNKLFPRGFRRSSPAVERWKTLEGFKGCPSALSEGSRRSAPAKVKGYGLYFRKDNLNLCLHPSSVLETYRFIRIRATGAGPVAPELKCIAYKSSKYDSNTKTDIRNKINFYFIKTSFLQSRKLNQTVTGSK